jgi:CheY-like chemotaxis protein
MKTILFVEDDTNIVEIYREGLLREGFEVLIAADGLAAMKSLHNTKPDLVILDLIMPKFSGAEVLKFIRSNPALKDTKVVVFSNDFMAEVALEAAKLSADATLLKFTCTLEQLINVVKTLLGDGHAGEEHPKP